VIFLAKVKPYIKMTRFVKVSSALKVVHVHRALMDYLFMKCWKLIYRRHTPTMWWSLCVTFFCFNNLKLCRWCMLNVCIFMFRHLVIFAMDAAVLQSINMSQSSKSGKDGQEVRTECSSERNNAWRRKLTNAVRIVENCIASFFASWFCFLNREFRSLCVKTNKSSIINSIY
jgi:hypothetical protein